MKICCKITVDTQHGWTQ